MSSGIKTSKIMKTYKTLRYFCSATLSTLLLTILSFFLPSYFCAQIVDTVKLKSVEVMPRYFFSGDNQNLRNLDSFLHTAIPVLSLGQILQMENTVQVKTYGYSGSSSSSIRGGNSSQTAVLWNGLNIRNPMLGENDLSLVTSYLFDDIQVQLGGSTALWGNASVAGSIHLKSFKDFSNQNNVSLFSGIGSFGHLSYGTKFNFSKEKYSSSTRFFIQKAENDFEFRNLQGGISKMSNSAMSQFGLMHESRYQLNEKNILNFNYWTQQNERQIGPALNQFSNNAFQEDRVNRFLLLWQHKHGRFNSYLRDGLFIDQIKYANPTLGIYTPSSAQTYITEAEFNYQFTNDDQINFGVNNTYCVAESEAYSEKVNQNYFSIFGNYLKESFSGKNKSLISLRNEHTLNQFQPFTYSISDWYEIASWLHIKYIFSKLYRLPTFNNMYWNPGGNPELKPESGRSNEIQIEAMKKLISIGKCKIDLNSTIGVFTRRVNNWIIWLPASNGIWTPQNLMSVWSRGVETNSTIALRAKRINYKLTLQTNYILSTNEKSQFENDLSIGRQLIYTPLYSGSALFQIHASRIYFTAINSYTGYRYTTGDNLNYLSPFHITHVFLGYNFNLANYICDINLAINNLFNTDYQAVAQRPMPLRAYQLNLKINYSKKTKTNK